MKCKNKFHTNSRWYRDRKREGERFWSLLRDPV